MSLADNRKVGCCGFRLTEKVVVVSGERGTGRAVWSLFERVSCVLFLDRDQAAGDALLSFLGTEDASFFCGDLTDPRNCEKAIETAVNRWGRIDVLVNNAGFNDGVSLERSPLEFDTSVQSNLSHVYALTHYAVQEIKVKGCVVNLPQFRSRGKCHWGCRSQRGCDYDLKWAAALASEKERNAVLPAECDTDQYRHWFNTLADPKGAKIN